MVNNNDAERRAETAVAAVESRKAQFVADVTARLWTWDDHVIDPVDLVHLQEDAGRMFMEGWTVEEVSALLRCTEEVTPQLAEGTALRRGAKIRAQVLERLAKK